jgi:RDD family
LKRGYVVLIIGAALLISGIIISILWAVPFAGTILRENTILSGVSIKPAGSVNAYTQVIDVSRPVSLGIHVERNNSTTGGQVPNNILRETVRNPNGIIMTSNEFSRQFFTTFKPDITGRYTVTVSNLGNGPVSIGVIAGNLPFIGANNKVNFGLLGGIIVGGILIVVGIIILIAGIIVVILDRRKITPKTQTTLPSSSSSETTSTETIVLARWIDRFIAWLIDFIIVSIGLAILFAVISLPFWIAFPQWFASTNMNMTFRNAGPLNYIIPSLVFMAYWTYFESTGGQSIGKKLLHLKTTDLVGKNIDLRTAVIESFGKAFLLPIDVILGWIFTNDKRQRIFNRASNTIVIKLKEDGSISENSKYVKD